MKSRVFRFNLFLTHRECQEYYQGLYTSIKVMTDVGISVQFPAHHIRPFVTSLGVKGKFELYLNESNKFIALKKIT
ncbi:DUF2835 family protein [Psychrosphaera haliotis]|uniref:DUF2835 family protein n=1 Tax=Psychrosphaera haliotis TaxID=555083 RepID=A0A6N8FA45_9GAMM|nr:DUF2835 family protein [Psychrosphaera haliotis]MUH71662.1 DUF2835 family protein [Psychrosphaera haliotis]